MKKSLDIPDVRNKLSPITTMINFIENGDWEWVMKTLPQVKKSVNYLADKEIYKDERNKT